MVLTFDWCNYTFDQAHEEPHNRKVLNWLGIANDRIDDLINDGETPSFDEISMIAGRVAERDDSTKTALHTYCVVKWEFLKIVDIDISGDNATVEVYTPNMGCGRDSHVILINYLSSQYEVVTHIRNCKMVEYLVEQSSKKLT